MASASPLTDAPVAAVTNASPVETPTADVAPKAPADPPDATPAAIDGGEPAPEPATDAAPSANDNQAPPEDQQPADRPVEFVDGRMVLQPAPTLAVYRIPKDGTKGLPAVPVTNSLTYYRRWAVACESRLDDKSCFATAYDQANQATVKIRLGAAAYADGNGEAGARIVHSVDGTIRYVLTIEAPQGLDEAAGLSVSGDGAFGILPLAGACSKTACITSAFVGEKGGVPSKARETDSTITVTGTVGDRGYVWRFSADGLADAFARVQAEMNGQPAPELVDAASQRPAPSARKRRDEARR